MVLKMTNDLEPRDSILGLLKAAIEIEKFGIRYYTALSSAVDNEKGKSFLNYLVTAEEKHQKTLEDIYNRQKEAGEEAIKALPLDNLGDEVEKLTERGCTILLDGRRDSGGVAYLDLNVGGIIVELVGRRDRS